MIIIGHKRITSSCKPQFKELNTDFTQRAKSLDIVNILNGYKVRKYANFHMLQPACFLRKNPKEQKYSKKTHQEVVMNHCGVNKVSNLNLKHPQGGQPKTTEKLTHYSQFSRPKIENFRQD